MPVLDRVDPEYLPIIHMVPLIDLNEIDAARAALHQVFAMAGTPDPHPDVIHEDHVLPPGPDGVGARVRTYRPRAATGVLPATIWIQGGGYVLTTLDPDDQWCERIALDQQCLVASVIWRRAPENPFPAAHDDCFGTLEWLVANATTLAIDATRIVVAGASSGGGAAASVALHARDAGIALKHQLLIYPMLDDRNVSRSSHEVTDPELWNRANNILAWKAYLGANHGTDNVSAYAAPARAATLEGLASTTILTGELDLFVDENLEYAQRLLAAKVPVELHLYPAVHHGFDRHNPGGLQARRIVADFDQALRSAFAPA